MVPQIKKNHFLKMICRWTVRMDVFLYRFSSCTAGKWVIFDLKCLISLSVLLFFFVCVAQNYIWKANFPLQCWTLHFSVLYLCGINWKGLFSYDQHKFVQKKNKNKKTVVVVACAFTDKVQQKLMLPSSILFPNLVCLVCK